MNLRLYPLSSFTNNFKDTHGLGPSCGFSNSTSKWPKIGLKFFYSYSMNWLNPLGIPVHYCELATTLRRRQWHPTPVPLLGKSHGRRSLEGCSPWGGWGSDTTEWLNFHALEKAMAPHSSVLAWRIPGTGEPGGLPSMGSHRVGHYWSDSSSSSNHLKLIVLPKFCQQQHLKNNFAKTKMYLQTFTNVK